MLTPITFDNNNFIFYFVTTTCIQQAQLSWTFFFLKENNTRENFFDVALQETLALDEVAATDEAIVV